MWHSCQSVACKAGLRNRPSQPHPIKKNLTHREVYERTLEKLQGLHNRGFTVVHVWEHEIIEKLKHDRDFTSFYNSNDLEKAYYEPIHPRAALKGGRTETFVLHKELTNEEIAHGLQIHHLDIVR